MSAPDSLTVACVECERESSAEVDESGRIACPPGWQARTTLPGEPVRYLCPVCVLRDTLKQKK